MNYLIGLAPALFWGLMPLIVSKFGGTPVQQLLGTVYGSTFCGILVYIYFLLTNPITIQGSTFLWCFVAGMAWSIAQITQYSSFRDIGVSMTMPTSTGTQLVGNSVVGVLFFGSWDTGHAKIAGALAILIIIFGVCMTAFQDKNQGSHIDKAKFRAGMIDCIAGGIGYIISTALPKVSNDSAWAKLLPQTLGMLAGAVILTLVIKQYRQQKPFFKKVTFLDSFAGISFGIAEVSYLFSIKDSINGLATGFTLSQMCVVVSTLSGIFILHEHKTHKELIMTLAGIVLVVIGGVITALLPQ